MSSQLVEPDVEQVEKKSKKPSTSHLKIVPETRELRDKIRAEIAKFATTLDRKNTFTKAELQVFSEQLLTSMGLGFQYTGFTSVCIANEFWREQVQATDFSRRLLLMPHCLKHAEGCPADYDEFGLDCRKCGACSVADFKTRAEDLGYKVLVSEGTPIVLKIIVSGHVDAIVGVACLNVLEKALDKILLAGVPCVAVPLLSSNCKSTSVDEDWVMEFINLKTPAPATVTRSYMHLMRASHQICEEPELSRLCPPSRSGVNTRAEDPLAVHEKLAYNWLGRGGKRSRPFITLAVYDALKGGAGTLNAESINIPDSVKRSALAIEAFHKASLIHDDIEDDDDFRYGSETMHRQQGVPVAINVGDYLVGLGYRLAAKDRAELGADVSADILFKLSDAHVKLSEGQGAELLWRNSSDKTITPLEALRIYALKTSPAFEAALYAGVRLAGPADDFEKMIFEFAKNLGIAFQILNDLSDFDTNSENKVVAGQDVLAGRPTVLLAMALETATPAQKEEILGLLQRARKGDNSFQLVERIHQLYQLNQVFDKGQKLVEKFRSRAEAIADEVQSEDFRRILYFLVDSVLEKFEAPQQAEPLSLIQLGKV
jgi:geranylgeranyl diphosphate synthase type II